MAKTVAFISINPIAVPTGDQTMLSVPSRLVIDFGLPGAEEVAVDLSTVPAENMGVLLGYGLRNWARDAQGKADGKQGERVAKRLAEILEAGGLPGAAGSPVDPVIAIAARVAGAKKLAKLAEASKWRTAADVEAAIGKDAAETILTAAKALL